MKTFTHIEKRLLDDFQRDFPLTPTPYADVAKQLNTDEETVINYLKSLQKDGIVSRVGSVFKANRVGVSTLAAIEVEEAELEKVADIVSSFSEVNHNYEREHAFNLWFVLNANNQDALQSTITKIEEKTKHAVMQLPMENDFYIDLGFKLQWT
jgi:DNA-binding Lrp family transcriptional regulator